MVIKSKHLVKCSITLYYNKDTFWWGEEDEDNPPSDEEVFKRCREYMIEDVTDLQNPFSMDVVVAEFVESQFND
jgi:hypothetical protein